MKLVDTNFMRRLASIVARKSNTNLGELETTNKESLVSAINEVVENTGDKAELTTKNKSNLVTAINEVNGKIKIYDTTVYLKDYSWIKSASGKLWYTVLFSIPEATQIISLVCTDWTNLYSVPLLYVKSEGKNNIAVALEYEPTDKSGLINIRVCYI